MDPALAVEVEEISHHRIINETITSGVSDIQKFYENKVIFVTGGSGFLGKQLIEKLLRSCNVQKIYMLMRPKKQKSIDERMQDIMQDTVFDVLRKMKPDFSSKLIAVCGDAIKLKLGLSDDDIERLTEEVEVIFHEAATINFMEPLKNATLTNVRGTREILNLGLKCKRLQAFVYVSTNYSAATYSRIGKSVEEKFYTAPVSPQALIEFAETLDEAKLDEITPVLTRDWPNTYTFTKTVAEELLRQQEGKIPIVLVRPGIVIGAYREPSPGWIDKSNVYGASGFILGSGLGVLHITNSRPTNKMGYVPVDLVNNATIISAPVTNKRWENGERDIKIYAIINCRNQITLKLQTEIIETKCVKYASEKAIYYPFYLTTPYKFLYTLLTWIMHLIPGYIVDGVLRLLGKKPMLVKVYDQVYKLNDVLCYFMHHDWKFSDHNLLQMYKSLSPADQIIYNCDIEDLNWERFILIWCIGIRKYVVKDDLKNTVYAVKKIFFLKCLHYIITPIYLYSLWKVFALFLFVVSWVVTFLFTFFKSIACEEL